MTNKYFIGHNPIGIIFRIPQRKLLHSIGYKPAKSMEYQFQQFNNYKSSSFSHKYYMHNVGVV